MLPFEKLLQRFRAHKLLRERGKQRTDSTHVLAAVHALNRLSCAGQTFRHALNVLATVAPDWFLEHSQPEWVERYAKSFEVDHTIKPSKRHAKRSSVKSLRMACFCSTPCLPTMLQLGLAKYP